MLNRKEFSTGLYDKYDSLAKSGFEEMMNKSSFLTDGGEMYCDGDIFLIKDDKRYLFELEVRPVWKSSGYFEITTSTGSFRPNTVTVPERKSTSKSDYFIAFNESLTSFALTRMKLVVCSRTIFKSTHQKMSNQETDNELFYKVSNSKFLWFQKNEGNWERFYDVPLWYRMRYQNDCKVLDDFLYNL